VPRVVAPPPTTKPTTKPPTQHYDPEGI
jgi:hypothetical protein